jgi:hypothetical protein
LSVTLLTEIPNCTKVSHQSNCCLRHKHDQQTSSRAPWGWGPTISLCMYYVDYVGANGYDNVLVKLSTSKIFFYEFIFSEKKEEFFTFFTFG